MAEESAQVSSSREPLDSQELLDLQWPSHTTLTSTSTSRTSTVSRSSPRPSQFQPRSSSNRPRQKRRRSQRSTQSTTLSPSESRILGPISAPASSIMPLMSGATLTLSAPFSSSSSLGVCNRRTRASWVATATRSSSSQPTVPKMRVREIEKIKIMFDVLVCNYFK